MGTKFRIVCYTADPEIALQASNAAFDRIAILDHIMTDYDPSSELLQLCQQAGGSPVAVSADLFRVLKEAQHWADLSGGAFDCTVGPVVQLWRRTRRQRELPDPERLATARALIGYTHVILDEKAGTVQLMKKGMRLDLGGIGKGFAADAALQIIKSWGITSAMVIAGGEVAVSQAPPGQPGWKIGILPLESPAAPLSRFLLLQDAAVSTSGDAAQYVEINGQRYSHIVDPRTGLGLTGHCSATIVAPNATTTDALATALNVLGPEKGLTLIESLEATSALILESGTAGIQSYTSKRWKEMEPSQLKIADPLQ
jgi:thiamine biosynthesis lipoprotein